MRQTANDNPATTLYPPVSGIIMADDRPRGRHFRKPDPEDYLFSQMPRARPPRQALQADRTQLTSTNAPLCATLADTGTNERRRRHGR